jgi:hypothetical protein
MLPIGHVFKDTIRNNRGEVVGYRVTGSYRPSPDYDPDWIYKSGRRRRGMTPFHERYINGEVSREDYVAALDRAIAGRHGQPAGWNPIDGTPEQQAADARRRRYRRA